MRIRGNTQVQRGSPRSRPTPSQSLLHTDNPPHPPHRPRMHHLPAPKAPPLQFSPPVCPPQQPLHLLRCPRPQTRDIAVVDEAEGDEGDEVGKEELEGPVPEVEGGEEGDERAEEEDGY